MYQKDLLLQGLVKLSLLKSSLALAELMAFSLRHSVLISGTRIHFGLIEYISSSPKLISSGIGTRLCSFLCLKQIALYSESYGFPSSHVWLWELAECQIIDAFELWCGRRLMRVPWTARKSNQSILKKINPEYSLVDWCWGWSSKTLATRCEELTHWKLPWYWERLKTEERSNRGRDSWMASLTQWTWIWANSRR